MNTSKLVTLTLVLLKENPTGWFYTHYRATHRETGITIWIANGRRLLHIEYSPKDIFNDPDFYKLSWYSRHKLWRQLKNRRKHVEQERYDQTVETIEDHLKATLRKNAVTQQMKDKEGM